jgi:hypothetical protein
MPTIAELRNPDDNILQRALIGLADVLRPVLDTEFAYPMGRAKVRDVIGNPDEGARKLADLRGLPTLAKPMDPDLLDFFGLSAAAAGPAKNIAKGTAKAIAREAASHSPKLGPSAQRGMIGGEGASMADLKKLAEAKRLHEAGVNRREIWDKTGWYRGPDGKWRFEIDDSEARMLPSSLDDKFRSVGEVIQHDPLATNYAALMGDNVFGGVFPKGVRGGRDRASGDIYINATMEPDDQLSTLLHELQHAIQQKEGFDMGSPFKRTGDLDADRAAYRRYRETPGEAEARMVQRRQNKTPEERKAKPPWESYDEEISDGLVRWMLGQPATP